MSDSQSPLCLLLGLSGLQAASLSTSMYGSESALLSGYQFASQFAAHSTSQFVSHFASQECIDASFLSLSDRTAGLSRHKNTFNVLREARHGLFLVPATCTLSLLRLMFAD